jgi:hypothetical protein
MGGDAPLDSLPIEARRYSNLEMCPDRRYRRKTSDAFELSTALISAEL